MAIDYPNLNQDQKQLVDQVSGEVRKVLLELDPEVSEGRIQIAIEKALNQVFSSTRISSDVNISISVAKEVAKEEWETSSGRKKAVDKGNFGDKFKEITGVVADVGLAFDFLKKSISGITAPIMGTIHLVEQFNEMMLQSQVGYIIATDSMDAFGNQIFDFSERMAISKDNFKQLMRDLEVETQNIVGLTSMRLDNVLSNIIQSSATVLPQYSSDVASSDTEMLKNLTANISATMALLQIPQAQDRHEIRSILQGNVNDPNATMAQKLGISKADVSRAMSEGKYVDFLMERTQPFREASTMAAGSWENISSNITELQQQVQRGIGEPVLKVLTDFGGKWFDRINQSERDSEKEAIVSVNKAALQFDRDIEKEKLKLNYTTDPSQRAEILKNIEQAEQSRAGIIKNAEKRIGEPVEIYQGTFEEREQKIKQQEQYNKDTADSTPLDFFKDMATKFGEAIASVTKAVASVGEAIAKALDALGAFQAVGAFLNAFAETVQFVGDSITVVANAFSYVLDAAGPLGDILGVIFGGLGDMLGRTVGIVAVFGGLIAAMSLGVKTMYMLWAAATKASVALTTFAGVKKTDTALDLVKGTLQGIGGKYAKAGGIKGIASMHAGGAMAKGAVAAPLALKAAVVAAGVGIGVGAVQGWKKGLPAISESLENTDSSVGIAIKGIVDSLIGFGDAAAAVSDRLLDTFTGGRIVGQRTRRLENEAAVDSMLSFADYASENQRWIERLYREQGGENESATLKEKLDFVDRVLEADVTKFSLRELADGYDRAKLIARGSDEELLEAGLDPSKINNKERKRAEEIMKRNQMLFDMYDDIGMGIEGAAKALARPLIGAFGKTSAAQVEASLELFSSVDRTQRTSNEDQKLQLDNLKSGIETLWNADLLGPNAINDMLSQMQGALANPALTDESRVQFLQQYNSLIEKELELTKRFTDAASQMSQAQASAGVISPIEDEFNQAVSKVTQKQAELRAELKKPIELQESSAADLVQQRAQLDFEAAEAVTKMADGRDTLISLAAKKEKHDVAIKDKNRIEELQKEVDSWKNSDGKWIQNVPDKIKETDTLLSRLNQLTAEEAESLGLSQNFVEQARIKDRFLSFKKEYSDSLGFFGGETQKTEEVINDVTDKLNSLTDNEKDYLINNLRVAPFIYGAGEVGSDVRNEIANRWQDENYVFTEEDAQMAMRMPFAIDTEAHLKPLSDTELMELQKQIDEANFEIKNLQLVIDVNEEDLPDELKKWEDKLNEINSTSLTNFKNLNDNEVIERADKLEVEIITNDDGSLNRDKTIEALEEKEKENQNKARREAAAMVRALQALTILYDSRDTKIAEINEIDKELSKLRNQLNSEGLTEEDRKNISGQITELEKRREKTQAEVTAIQADVDKTKESKERDIERAEEDIALQRATTSMKVINLMSQLADAEKLLNIAQARLKYEQEILATLARQSELTRQLAEVELNAGVSFAPELYQEEIARKKVEIALADLDAEKLETKAIEDASFINRSNWTRTVIDEAAGIEEEDDEKRRKQQAEILNAAFKTDRFTENNVEEYLKGAQERSNAINSLFGKGKKNITADSVRKTIEDLGLSSLGMNAEDVTEDNYMQYAERIATFSSAIVQGGEVLKESQQLIGDFNTLEAFEKYKKGEIGAEDALYSMVSGGADASELVEREKIDEKLKKAAEAANKIKAEDFKELSDDDLIKISKRLGIEYIVDEKGELKNRDSVVGEIVKNSKETAKEINALLNNEIVDEKILGEKNKLDKIKERFKEAESAEEVANIAKELSIDTSGKDTDELKKEIDKVLNENYKSILEASNSANTRKKLMLALDLDLGVEISDGDLEKLAMEQLAESTADLSGLIPRDKLNKQVNDEIKKNERNLTPKDLSDKEVIEAAKSYDIKIVTDADGKVDIDALRLKVAEAAKKYKEELEEVLAEEDDDEAIRKAIRLGVDLDISTEAMVTALEAGLGLITSTNENLVTRNELAAQYTQELQKELELAQSIHAAIKAIIETEMERDRRVNRAERVELAQGDIGVGKYSGTSKAERNYEEAVINEREARSYLERFRKYMTSEQFEELADGRISQETLQNLRDNPGISNDEFQAILQAINATRERIAAATEVAAEKISNEISKLGSAIDIMSKNASNGDIITRIAAGWGQVASLAMRKRDHDRQKELKERGKYSGDTNWNSLSHQEKREYVGRSAAEMDADEAYEEETEALKDKQFEIEKLQAEVAKKREIIENQILQAKNRQLALENKMAELRIRSDPSLSDEQKEEMLSLTAQMAASIETEGELLRWGERELYAQLNALENWGGNPMQALNQQERVLRQASAYFDDLMGHNRGVLNGIEENDGIGKANRAIDEFTTRAGDDFNTGSWYDENGNKVSARPDKQRTPYWFNSPQSGSRGWSSDDIHLTFDNSAAPGYGGAYGGFDPDSPYPSKTKYGTVVEQLVNNPANAAILDGVINGTGGFIATGPLSPMQEFIYAIDEARQAGRPIQPIVDRYKAGNRKDGAGDESVRGYGPSGEVYDPRTGRPINEDNGYAEVSSQDGRPGTRGADGEDFSFNANIVKIRAGKVYIVADEKAMDNGESQQEAGDSHIQSSADSDKAVKETSATQEDYNGPGYILYPHERVPQGGEWANIPGLEIYNDWDMPGTQNEGFRRLVADGITEPTAESSKMSFDELVKWVGEEAEAGRIINIALTPAQIEEAIQAGHITRYSAGPTAYDEQKDSGEKPTLPLGYTEASNFESEDGKTQSEQPKLPELSVNELKAVTEEANIVAKVVYINADEIKSSGSVTQAAAEDEAGGGGGSSSSSSAGGQTQQVRDEREDESTRQRAQVEQPATQRDQNPQTILVSSEQGMPLAEVGNQGGGITNALFGGGEPLTIESVSSEEVKEISRKWGETGRERADKWDQTAREYAEDVRTGKEAQPLTRREWALGMASRVGITEEEYDKQIYTLYEAQERGYQAVLDDPNASQRAKQEAIIGMERSQAGREAARIKQLEGNAWNEEGITKTRLNALSPDGLWLAPEIDLLASEIRKGEENNPYVLAAQLYRSPEVMATATERANSSEYINLPRSYADSPAWQATEERMNQERARREELRREEFEAREREATHKRRINGDYWNRPTLEAQQPTRIETQSRELSLPEKPIREEVNIPSSLAGELQANDELIPFVQKNTEAGIITSVDTSDVDDKTLFPLVQNNGIPEAKVTLKDEENWIANAPLTADYTLNYSPPKPEKDLVTTAQAPERPRTSEPFREAGKDNKRNISYALESIIPDQDEREQLQATLNFGARDAGTLVAGRVSSAANAVGGKVQDAWNALWGRRRQNTGGGTSGGGGAGTSYAPQPPTPPPGRQIEGLDQIPDGFFDQTPLPPPNQVPDGWKEVPLTVVRPTQPQGSRPTRPTPPPTPTPAPRPTPPPTPPIGHTDNTRKYIHETPGLNGQPRPTGGNTWHFEWGQRCQGGGGRKRGSGGTLEDICQGFGRNQSNSWQFDWDSFSHKNKIDNRGFPENKVPRVPRLLEDNLPSVERDTSKNRDTAKRQEDLLCCDKGTASIVTKLEEGISLLQELVNTSEDTQVNTTVQVDGIVELSTEIKVLQNSFSELITSVESINLENEGEGQEVNQELLSGIDKLLVALEKVGSAVTFGVGDSIKEAIGSMIGRDSQSDRSLISDSYDWLANKIATAITSSFEKIKPQESSANDELSSAIVNAISSIKIEVPEIKVPDISLEPIINVEASNSEFSIDYSQITDPIVSSISSLKLEPPVVNVEPPVVNVEPPVVNVEASSSEFSIDYGQITEPIISSINSLKLEPPVVNVEPPVVNVEQKENVVNLEYGLITEPIVTAITSLRDGIKEPNLEFPRFLSDKDYNTAATSELSIDYSQITGPIITAITSLKLEPPTVNVEAPVVNVEPPIVNVESQASELSIDYGQITGPIISSISGLTLQSPDVIVNPPEVNITIPDINVPEPKVNVNVEPPQISLNELISSINSAANGVTSAINSKNNLDIIGAINSLINVVNQVLSAVNSIEVNPRVEVNPQITVTPPPQNNASETKSQTVPTTVVASSPASLGTVAANQSNYNRFNT